MPPTLPFRTLAPWLESEFGRPVYRVALDAGSTCPNRDGSKGLGGCTYCDVEGGFTGTGNIDADPLFVDAPGGDYQLQFGSPCMDGGDPLDLVCGVDLTGRPRRLAGLRVAWNERSTRC